MLRATRHAPHPVRASLPRPCERAGGVLRNGMHRYHHIHHLNARVPGYNLQRCHEEADARLWRGIPRLGGREMLRSLSYTLWDEELKMFV